MKALIAFSALVAIAPAGIMAVAGAPLWMVGITYVICWIGVPIAVLDAERAMRKEKLT